MAKSNKPQNVDKITWYYENDKSITIVREIYIQETGLLFRTEQFNIPIRMLKTSIRRIESKTRPKSAEERKDDA